MEIIAPAYLLVMMALIIGEWLGSTNKTKEETK